MNPLHIAALVFRTLVNCAFPVALLFCMTRFRCARRTAWLFWGVSVALSVAVNCLLLFTVGQERMMQVFFLVTALPCLIFLLLQSKDRPAQLLFSFFTAINALYLVSILARLSLFMREDLIFFDALLRAVLYGLIILAFQKLLNRPYRFLADNMPRGWRLIALVPLLFFALVMFLGLYPHVRTDNFPAVLMLYGLLVVVYGIIDMVFSSTYALLLGRHDNQLLASQAAALQSQLTAIANSEEQMRMYRHDMRHFLRSISQLLHSGDTAGALAVCEQFSGQLQKAAPRRYCADPVLGAVLAFYLGQAEAAGIEVEARCQLPDKLPVEAIELAAVLANAIENAVAACKPLPADRHPFIRVYSVCGPPLVLEVTNSCGAVMLDKNGQPVAATPGHGIGTRSIAAFAKKCGATVDYQVKDGVFSFRLLLNSDGQQIQC